MFAATSAGIFLAEPAQHFARTPHWTWYILFYFFFAGVAGGSYLIATLFRLKGRPSDEPMARLGYYIAFGMLLLCPPMLILDLGQPLRFWHMMWSLTPGEPGLNFKGISPMSVGVWGLLGFSAFATIAVVQCLVNDGKIRIAPLTKLVRLLDGGLGKVVNIIGSFFAIFLAGYTGVLLAVSNQAVWSDTWTLGGLFLSSGLSSSIAMMMLLSRFRKGAQSSEDVLHLMERLFTPLEIGFIILFVVVAWNTGALAITFGMPWTILWIITFISLIPGVIALATKGLRPDDHGVSDHAIDTGGGHGGVALATRATATHTASMTTTVLLPLLTIAGVMCLRAAIILSPQF